MCAFFSFRFSGISGLVFRFSPGLIGPDVGRLLSLYRSAMCTPEKLSENLANTFSLLTFGPSRCGPWIWLCYQSREGRNLAPLAS